MEIIDLQLQKRSITLKRPFITALRRVTKIDVMDVYIELKNGMKGLGSAASTLQITGESMEGIQAIIHQAIKPQIVHKDIRQLGKLITHMEKSCVGNSSAKAAVEIALHDAYCQYLDISLNSYLGGQVHVLETDMTVSIDQPEIMQKEALKRVSEGFNVLKVKVGKDEKLDLIRLRSIRDAVGQDISFRLDANQGWNKKQAVNIIGQLEEENMGVELVEQPVPADDIEGLKYIHDRVTTPIMADESVFSPANAFHLLEMKAIDMLNIKLMKTGGIRRARQIADLCQAAGIPCMIGSMMESIISVTAAAHLAAAHPNITHYDLDAPLWMSDEPVKGGMNFKGRGVMLSEGSGIGIQL
ncbi:L-alanine-DL-glutamate epimerase [Salinibacillus kushneri]|uniref:Dipeptide epimerase n=1 Tax=Salinibacillus kushneri TaxID=237682 RepID=A0A1I0JIH7_9BACI|nr:dipeptide epimerase [Salinibacillus kushneri]SEU10142.1 L-alanine-DL-glutamate epimerase [Salinibacillus kushneri]